MRRARRRLGDLVGGRQRHRLPRPRRLERRGRSGRGRGRRGAPRDRRVAARDPPSRGGGVRLRRVSRAPHAPRRRLAGRLDPRLLAAAVAHGRLRRRRPTARCGAGRSPTPRSCGRSRRRPRERPRGHRRRRDGPVHGLSRVRALRARRRPRARAHRRSDDGLVRAHALIPQRLPRRDLRAAGARGLRPVGRLRGAHRHQGARPLRLPEHRQALGHPQPRRTRTRR